MEFDLPRTVGLLVAVIGLGVGGLVAGDMMPLRIVMMMVLPSMAVFAAVVFVLGVKHGEYRASR
jgi:hypothetical protein